MHHGPGPGLLLFCLVEQTGVGEKRREPRNEGDRSGDHGALVRGRLGGPDAGGTQGTLFLFLNPVLFYAVRMGSCWCLGVGALRMEPLHPSPSPLSVIHKLLRHQRRRSRWGGSQRFKDALESVQTSSREERTFFGWSPGRSAFFIATKEVPVSQRACK